MKTQQKTFKSSPSLRRRTAMAFLSALALMAAAGGGRGAEAHHPVTLTDLTQGYPGATLSLSPDRKRLAVDNNGRLVLLDFPSGRLEQELGQGLMPQWAPSGGGLTFYSTRSGKLQLWLWSEKAGAKQLTRFADGIDPDFYARFLGYGSDALAYEWSPDSRRLVFASRVAVALGEGAPEKPLVLTNTTDPDQTSAGACALASYCAADVRLFGRDIVEGPVKRGQSLINALFVVDASTGATAQITGPDRIFYDPIWMNDGSVLAGSIVTGGRIGSIWSALSGAFGKPDVQIATVNPADKSVHVLFDNVGAPRKLTLSNRGDQVYFSTSGDYYEHPHLMAGDLTSGRIRSMGESSWVTDIRHSGGNGVEVSYSQNSKPFVADLRPDSQELTNVRKAGSAYDGTNDSAGGLIWVDADEAVQYLARSANQPSKLFGFRREGLEFGREETVTWTNSRGEMLKGSLLYPVGYVAGRRYPLIVDAYPITHADGWMDSMESNQTWAAAGYVVFMPGERAPHVWMNAADKAFGAEGKGPDGFKVGLDDLLSGVDALAVRGVIDPDRMCLYGHSNGGGAASYFVTMTDRFKCAVVAAPASTNWVGWALWTTGGRSAINMASGGYDISRDPEDFIKMSAVFSLYRSKTPMLIGCGDDDPTLVDAIGVYNAVRDAGVPVTFVRYPSQGHVLTGDAMQDFWSRQMAFFATYLQAAPATPKPR
jgi:dipeptidyl aminopeptidase/acylaminoacyl peptidase